LNYEIIKTKFDYFSIKNPPTQKELKKYYSQKYYQDESTQFSHKYSDNELVYFKNKAKIASHIYNQTFYTKEKSLLEVGAGEGFFANYFFQKEWNITSLDYSEYGMKQHNPHLLHTLKIGDVFNSINNLINLKSTYNLINLSNILEHVIDPIDLLKKLRLLLSKESLLRISVPNDYSNFQNYLLENNYTTDTWFCPPEHLHYFSFDSLSKLLIFWGMISN